LNLPQNCHTKHCTRHYAKPLLNQTFGSLLNFTWHRLHSILLDEGNK
jgi:hypothetical protein